MDDNIKMLVKKHWALLDVEFIRTSPTHCCIRKLYIKDRNGYDDMELEFFPCKRYKELEWKYQQSFQYCRSRIHKLSYNPKKRSPRCSRVLPLLNEFIVNNAIELIIYKGGSIEKDLAKALDILSMNIECFKGSIKKANSHDPRIEVDCYLSQIIMMINNN